MPEIKPSGVCAQNSGLYTKFVSATISPSHTILTHPVTGNSAPAVTAPSDTPVVKPAFTIPTNRPLLFLPVNSSTRIIEIVIIPAPPIPLIVRPARKIAREGAWDVISPPKEKAIADTNRHFRGENSCDKRPATGAQLDIAIYR
jgi:hypothetical protein